MATTAFGTNHPLAVKLWSKKLMREALKETYVSRFMGTSKNSLCYVKDDLTKSPGDRIRVGLRMQLSGAGVQGDATLEGNEESLTTFTDNLLIDQQRHAVRSDGEMSDQRIPFSVREEALDGLRDWWADRIDTAFFNSLGGNTSASLGLTGLNAATAPTSATGNVRVMLALGAGATSTTASLTESLSAHPMTLDMIDRMINQAKIATPLIRPLRINGQSKYVLFLHPNQMRQLRTDNTANTITWFDIMRARVQGGERDSNPIFSGAAGEYNSVILHESTRVPSLDGEDRVKKAIFAGAQAACFGTGRRDAGQQMKWTEELFDYENQLGVASSMIWGLKKTVFNDIDFSTIVGLTVSENPV